MKLGKIMTVGMLVFEAILFFSLYLVWQTDGSEDQKVMFTLFVAFTSYIVFELWAGRKMIPMRYARTARGPAALEQVRWAEENLQGWWSTTDETADAGVFIKARRKEDQALILLKWGAKKIMEDQYRQSRVDAGTMSELSWAISLLLNDNRRVTMSKYSQYYPNREPLPLFDGRGVTNKETWTRVLEVKQWLNNHHIDHLFKFEAIEDKRYPAKYSRKRLEGNVAPHILVMFGDKESAAMFKLRWGSEQ